MLKISVYSAGYVGLVTAVCLAEIGHQVVCIDINHKKIEQLQHGKLPFFEPQLKDLIFKNIKLDRLQFTSDIKFAANFAMYHMIAVGTPSLEDGSADLSAVYNVAEQLAENCLDNLLVIIKSTVPVGTADAIFQFIGNKLDMLNKSFKFDVVSNPEFLREGNAIQDFLSADRIIIGAVEQGSIEYLQQLYQPLINNEIPFIVMGRRSAELTKYAANAMLATKISLMNELSNIAECYEADIEQVKLGISYDKRIGPHFISAGCGYGGSCFPKDIAALQQMGLQHDYFPQLVATVASVNQAQKQSLYNKIYHYYIGQLANKTMAVWGLAFKANTDDLREASSIAIINSLSQYNVKLQVYDPAAIENAKTYFNNLSNISYSQSKEEALDNADCLIIITEWDEFRETPIAHILKHLNYPVIFDGRNIFSLTEISLHALDYISIGRKAILNFKDK